MKLEWQIESDHYRGSGQQHLEDPEFRRQRRRRTRRILLTVLAMFAVVAAVLWFIQHRLNEADERVRLLLENTVRTEITALNLGEQVTFERIQRSASDEWLRTQAEWYLQYQADKVITDRVLTGRILSMTVERQRGRVQVEEIENGVPYVRTWFYWNYDAVRDEAGNVLQPAGWYHVPPDYTFWGEPRAIQRERFVVRYQALDAPFAASLVAQLSGWYDLLCAALDCSRLSYLTVDVVPNPGGRVTWQSEADWQLIVPSPYTTRARYDQPFYGALAREVANLLAQRAVSTVSLTPDRELDSQFVKESAERWLVGRWLQVDNGAYLIESIVQQYGAASISRLLAEMRPNSAISLVSRALQIDLGSAPLDWRDFLSYRLAVEEQAARRGDLQTLARLYEPTPQGQQRAAERLMATGGATVVVSVTRETSPQGLPQLFAVTADGQAVIFRLVDGIWVRAG
ncbi:hypothetical protein VZO05_07200 [Aggregatilineales bacterium SYSU G02658]